MTLRANLWCLLAELTTLRPVGSSTVIRATNFPFRRHSPRIECLRLSKTLVYVYRRDLETDPS